jgi:hypothetical protein
MTEIISFIRMKITGIIFAIIMAMCLINFIEANKKRLVSDKMKIKYLLLSIFLGI